MEFLDLLSGCQLIKMLLHIAELPSTPNLVRQKEIGLRKKERKKKALSYRNMEPILNAILSVSWNAVCLCIRMYRSECEPRARHRLDSVRTLHSCLKTKAFWCFETSVTTRPRTQRHFAGDWNVQHHHCSEILNLDLFIPETKYRDSQNWIHVEKRVYSSPLLSAGIRVPGPPWILQSVDNTEPHILRVF